MKPRRAQGTAVLTAGERVVAMPGQQFSKARGQRSEISGRAASRSAPDNATVRSVFVIGPDKAIKAMISYPMSTGRNFDEVLRLLDSLQLTARHKVATPVNWRRGEDVIIVPAVSDDEARTRFPQGWKSPKPYLRIVSQPS